jgi:hypothetical protein
MSYRTMMQAVYINLEENEETGFQPLLVGMWRGAGLLEAIGNSACSIE